MFEHIVKSIIDVFRGFTKFNRAEYTKLRAMKRIVPDGVNAKVCLIFTQFELNLYALGFG